MFYSIDVQQINKQIKNEDHIVNHSNFVILTISIIDLSHIAFDLPCFHFDLSFNYFTIVVRAPAFLTILDHRTASRNIGNLFRVALPRAYTNTHAFHKPGRPVLSMCWLAHFHS
ncbi:hypothetical protein BLOT_011252 [Blomia tropicalis]|nr:hypothetical protein BLOT_011252 [Blomia tropicalis]